MKKLLLVSHQLDYSGAPNALLSAARVLREMGNELDLFPLVEGPLEDEFLSIGVRRTRSPNFNGYDLVILNTAICAKVALRIPDGVKYLIWLHESPLLFVHSDLPFIVAQAAERAVAIMFPTESTAKEWARYGPLRSDVTKIFCSYAPVTIPELSKEANCALSAAITKPEPLKIITIDPVEYFRGHRVLSQALQCLVSSGIDVHYTAAGASRSAIQALFPFLTEQRLAATERIPRVQILEYLAQSHVYVSASSFATQNLGLCEAALMGIPAVVSDIPVHRAFCTSVSSAVILTRLFCWKSLAENLQLVFENYTSWRCVSRLSTRRVTHNLSSEKLKSILAFCAK